MKTKAQNDIDEIISISIPQIIELDEAEGITYKAHAPIGTDATTGLTLPVWTIYRIRTSGVRTITEVAKAGAGNLVYDSGAAEYKSYTYTF